MRCLEGVSGAVMWGRCAELSALQKLQGGSGKMQDELVCVLPHCMQQKQCCDHRHERPQQCVFALNSFPRESPGLCQNANTPPSQ